MATRTAKLRVQVDGEKEYKQAIADLNKGNQVLASEMRKLQAEYKGNEGSIEALNKKGDLLQRQLLQQKDKVQALREALQNAAKQYGEADRRTQEWQIKVNDAEAAQAKLEHAVEENNEAIKAQGQAVDGESKKMVSLGDAVEKVAGKLGVNIPDGAKKALDGMKGMSAGSVAAMSAIAAGVTAVIKAIKELNELTLQAATRADDLLTQSVVSGVSTDMLQQFQYAAPYIDVSAETMTAALTKITRSAATARDQIAAYGDSVQAAAEQGKSYEGSLGTQADAFARLGVSVTDSTGQLRDAQEVMFEALEALGGIGNETERDALAMELFGKSAQELNPLILNLDEAQRLYNEALSEGFVLTEDQLKILGEVDDAHNKYTQTVQKNKDLIATQWAPATKEAYESLAALMSKAGKALVDSKLVENAGALVASTLNLIEAGASLIDSLPKWINPIENVSKTMKGLAVVAATVADSMSLIASLMTLDFHGAATALGMNLHKGEMSHLQQLKYSDPKYVHYNAAGDENWRGGLTWVGEAGPELVSLPRGSQIYSNQESQQMAAVGTDTSRMEALLARNVQLLEQISGEFSGLRVRRRMA